MPAEPPARAILLDIEGTTTPLEFVREVLFPYARQRVERFLKEHGGDPEVGAAVDLIRADQRADERPGPIASYVRWLIDQDRKSTGLKSLQGMIWELGYLNGDLRGAVYADVPPAFSRWKAQGRRVAIFSSGSVLAQKLLFKHSDHGDLTGWIDGYFDTNTGPKNDARSYRVIAAALGLAPAALLFVSDTPAEVDSARTAGLHTRLCDRAGANPVLRSVVRDLENVFP